MRVLFFVVFFLLIFGQNIGPAKAGPAGPSTTALIIRKLL
jgi:hypothetical protein